LKIQGGYILQPRCFDQSESSHFPPVAREVWLYLLRRVNHKDVGKFGRGQGFFSLTDIQKDLSWMVGYRREMYSKPQITKALRRLREGNMIEVAKATRGVFVTVCNYNFYQDPESYEVNGNKPTKEARRKHEGIHLKQECKNERKTDTALGEEQNGIPYGDIVSFLNEKTGKSFKSTTSATQKFIKARWKEGFRLQDFKTVIENKASDWQRDPKMAEYLRPQTLFGEKFESYLNGQVKSKDDGWV